VQSAAHRDAVAGNDELEVHRASVGEMGEAFEHQDGRSARRLQYGGGVGVGIHRLQGDLGVAEVLPGEGLEETEDIGVLQIGIQQIDADVDRT
jgi:hypothetical protein